MAGRAGVGARARRSGARALPARAADRQGAPLRRLSAVQRQHGVHQHHSAGARGAFAGRSRARAPHPLAGALERDGDGDARQQGIIRTGRPHRQLCLGGDAVRRRLQPFLPRRQREDHGGDLVYYPGPFLARHLCARLPRRPPHRRAAGQFPPGSGRQGPVLLSASLADAGFLAVPDRVHGPGAADGDLPGALHEVPAGPRPGRTPRAARSGRSWATARWTSRNRWARSRWPAARNSTT